MTNWFISDTHFGHTRVLEFCPASRPCSTIEEHDERIIDNWNADVKPEDTVYILGDVSWHGPEQTKNILRRLNGHKNLILGNHDRQFSQEGQFKGLIEDTCNYREIKIDKIDVILCHYPLARWNKCHYGSLHLWGHEHGAFDNGNNRSMDVGIDARPNGDMKLWAWEEVWVELKDREILKHH